MATRDGDDYLITGHESLGRVVEAGSHAPRALQPGILVVDEWSTPGLEEVLAVAKFG